MRTTTDVKNPCEDGISTKVFYRKDKGLDAFFADLLP
jgi:hypothetical protein